MFKTDERGRLIGLLPTWGDKVGPTAKRSGAIISNPDDARQYEAWLGRRYRDSGDNWRAWLGPRNGKAHPIGEFARREELVFAPPREGGPDWVLVVDDAARGFAAPGA